MSFDQDPREAAEEHSGFLAPPAMSAAMAMFAHILESKTPAVRITHAEGIRIFDLVENDEIPLPELSPRLTECIAKHPDRVYRSLCEWLAVSENVARRGFSMRLGKPRLFISGRILRESENSIVAYLQYHANAWAWRMRRTRNALGVAFLARLLVAVILLVFSYSVDWGWLQNFTAEMVVSLHLLLGSSIRVADTNEPIVAAGDFVCMSIERECCLVDGIAATLPFVCLHRRSLVSIAAWSVAFVLAAILCNVFRLALLVSLAHRGIPWTLAHDLPYLALCALLVGTAYLGSSGDTRFDLPKKR